MKYSYIFYETDESFDYGDWSWGGTCYQTAEHGFDIEIDDDNNIDITTLDAYGDYAEVSEIKTLKDLRLYIMEHFNEIQIERNRECFQELVDMISDQILKKEI